LLAARAEEQQRVGDEPEQEREHDHQDQRCLRGDD
jgi:hypothetical protein